MSPNFTILDRSAPRVLCQPATISVDLASMIQLTGVFCIARDLGNPLVAARVEPNDDRLPRGRRGVELAPVSSGTQLRAGVGIHNSPGLNSTPAPVFPMKSAFFSDGIVFAYTGEGGKS